MPISKSAKKALRSSIAKRSRNVKIKENLKQTIKKATEKNLSEVFSVIDKAAKRFIIHKNKAARIKSRLAKKFSGRVSEKKVEPKKQVSRSKIKQAKKSSKKSSSKKKNKKSGKKKK